MKKLNYVFLSAIIFTLLTTPVLAKEANSENAPMIQKQDQDRINEPEGETNREENQVGQELETEDYDPASDSNESMIQNQEKNGAEIEVMEIQGNEEANGNQNKRTAREQIQTTNTYLTSLNEIKINDEPLQTRLKKMVQEQTQSQETVEAQLQEVQNRRSWVHWFIGPNFGAINLIETEITQNEERIQTLNEIKSEFQNSSEADQIALTIQAIQQENNALQEQIKQEQEKFSLLGWLFRLF